jgi:hypothetical protein
MPLFWLVHEIDGKRRIFIQEAGALIFARIRAGIAGFEQCGRRRINPARAASVSPS